MTIATNCGQAEILAGAIALGEATDAERHAYREHLSTCRYCLSSMGGEREIERVADVVAQARNQERWEPQPRNVFARVRAGWKTANLGAALAASVIVVLGVWGTTQYRPTVVHSVAAPPKESISAAQEARAIAALGTQTVPRRVHHAESLAFGEGSDGDRMLTLQVSFDSHGKPTHCRAIEPSGHRAVGAAFCAAVMQQR